MPRRSFFFRRRFGPIGPERDRGSVAPGEKAERHHMRACGEGVSSYCVRRRHRLTDDRSGSQWSHTHA